MLELSNNSIGGSGLQSTADALIVRTDQGTGLEDRNDGYTCSPREQALIITYTIRHSVERAHR